MASTTRTTRRRSPRSWNPIKTAFVQLPLIDPAQRSRYVATQCHSDGGHMRRSPISETTSALSRKYNAGTGSGSNDQTDKDKQTYQDTEMPHGNPCQRRRASAVMLQDAEDIPLLDPVALDASTSMLREKAQLEESIGRLDRTIIFEVLVFLLGIAALANQYLHKRSNLPGSSSASVIDDPIGVNHYTKLALAHLPLEAIKAGCLLDHQVSRIIFMTDTFNVFVKSVLYMSREAELWDLDFADTATHGDAVAAAAQSLSSAFFHLMHMEDGGIFSITSELERFQEHGYESFKHDTESLELPSGLWAHVHAKLAPLSPDGTPVGKWVRHWMEFLQKNENTSRAVSQRADEVVSFATQLLELFGFWEQLRIQAKMEGEEACQRIERRMRRNWWRWGGYLCVAREPYYVDLDHPGPENTTVTILAFQHWVTEAKIAYLDYAETLASIRAQLADIPQLKQVLAAEGRPLTLKTILEMINTVYRQASEAEDQLKSEKEQWEAKDFGDFDFFKPLRLSGEGEKGHAMAYNLRSPHLTENSRGRSGESVVSRGFLLL